jgi:flagellar protein FliS
MNATAAISTYKKVKIESSVAAADSHLLIAMLFQGALLSIADARNSMARKDIPAKGAAISHAITIIGEGLHASLDKNSGGELAQNLSALYDYMVIRLVEANLNNDVARLDEVAQHLTGLKEAWDSIRPEIQQAMQMPQPGNAPQSVYGRT